MKDLGYESLRISLSEKDFNNKLKKIKKAEIRYKDENIQKTEEDFIDGDFLEVFKDTGIEKNLVSVFVLTLNLLDIIRKDKNDQDLFKNIFSFGSPDYGTMQKLLLDAESFLKRLAGLIYGPSIIEIIDNNKWTFANFINIEYNGDSFINTRFKDFAYVLKEYKNQNASHDVINSKYIFTNDERARELVLSSIACFVLLIVNDKFDKIDDVLQNPDIITDKKVSNELGKYVTRIERKQKEQLNAIYSITEDNEKGLNSISKVSLKQFNDEGGEWEEESRILLAGESGTGKSTLLAEMVYKDIQQWKSDNNSLLPIKIELSKYEDEYKDNFFSFIVSQIKYEIDLRNKIKADIDIIHNALRQYFIEGKIKLYVDGINELSPKLGINRNDVIGRLLDLTKDYPKCKYIVTSRIKDMGLDEGERKSSYSIIIKDGTLVSFKRYDLQPFNSEQVEEQIGNYLKAIGIEDDQKREKKKERIIGRITKDRIEELVKNPLQLNLIIKYYKNERNESLSVSNRSQLFINLTKDLFDNSDDDKPKNIKEFLLRIADQQYLNKDNQGLTINDIQTLWPNGDVERMLKTTIKFGIMEKESDGYNFRHDSWREHFQAFSIAKKLVENESPNDTLQKLWEESNHFKDREVMNILRQIFEIMEMNFFVSFRNTWKKNIYNCQGEKENIQRGINKEENNILIYQKDRYNENTRNKLIESKKKIKEFQSLLNKIDSQVVEENNNYITKTFEKREFMCHFAKSLLKYDNGLKILSYATATMDSIEIDNYNTSYPLPKTIVEQKITNMMELYKEKNSEGITSSIDFKNDFNTKLKPIFEDVALSGSKTLLERLFDLYWLNIWLNIWKNKESEKVRNKLNVLAGILICKCENQLSLFYRIFDAYQKLCELDKIENANQVERLMMRLITQMNDRDAKEIIDDFTNKDKINPIEFAHKRRIGPKLLLGLNDVNSIFKALSMLKDYKFDTTIHLLTVENLLKKFKDLRMQAFLIGSSEREGLIETLPQGDEDHLMILNFLFLRYKDINKEYKDSFRKYLESEKGQSVVSMHHELLDLLTLEEVPNVYRSHYDLINYNTEDGFYKTTQVNYTLFRKDKTDNGCVYTIAIPKPQNGNIATSDIEFIADTDSEKVYSGNYTIEEQQSHNRTLLLIKWTAKKTLHIKAEGKIRLTKDHCVMLQSFKNLKDLIWLNHPERYHNSICDRLIHECNDYDDFNEMFYFFKEKSHLSQFLSSFYSRFMDKSISHNWDIGIIDYCAILRKEAQQIRIFSSYRSNIQNMYSTGILNKVSFRKGAISTFYDLEFEVDFAVLEKNGKLSLIDDQLLNFENKHLFGFIDGIVKSENCEYKIMAEGLKIQKYESNNQFSPLAFDFDYTKFKLKENDKVIFFPTLIFDNNGETFKAEEIEII